MNPADDEMNPAPVPFHHLWGPVPGGHPGRAYWWRGARPTPGFDERERIYQGTIDFASINIWLRDLSCDLSAALRVHDQQRVRQSGPLRAIVKPPRDL